MMQLFRLTQFPELNPIYYIYWFIKVLRIFEFRILGTLTSPFKLSKKELSKVLSFHT